MGAGCKKEKNAMNKSITLGQILDAVTPEDERNYFIAVEYIADYKGTVDLSQ